VGPYVPRSGQIPEEHNDLCSSGRLARTRNIRLVLMFLDHVRSPRNITTYVPWPGQEHKVGHHVPRPGRGT
jgi:hypothetical protein